jgi:hypothetical protein
MKSETSELIDFHLTGERPKAPEYDPTKLKLLPALLSGYRELSEIRHAYPLVLVDGESAQPIESLSGLVNSILQSTAPRGIGGERMRKNVLSLEKEIRTLSFQKKSGLLSEVWSEAADRLLSKTGLSAEDKEELAKNLGKARSALGCDGQMVSCDAGTPIAVVTHAWRSTQHKRNQSVQKELREIVVGLRGILESDHMKSNEARTPEALQATVGTSFEDEFDFQAMSKALPKVKAVDLLPKNRRRRIESAISVLESQKFFGSGQDEGGHSFEAASCTEALSAFRKRLPEMVDFAAAIRIAGLEIENAYREEKHDEFFKQFDADSLSAQDIALFPFYLVCMSDKGYDDANKAAMIEILSSELPIKVLFQTSEVFEKPSVENGGGAFAGWNLGLANMAMSLGTAFVLQTTGSGLYQMRGSICEGLTWRGPSLFSVFAGADANHPDFPPYLVSASAMQSRAFPTLLYNPQNGNDWASRICVSSNPQPERIWPVEEFHCQDEEAQRVSEEITFTLVDHLSTDRRFADNFMPVPRGDWNEQMVPLRECLEGSGARDNGKVPFILMVDGDNFLHRVVVGKTVIKAAKRYASSWRNLQELGGIDNSHALRLLDAEKQIWEEEKQKEIDELKSRLGEESAAEVVGAPPAAEAQAEAEVEAEVEEISPDVAYIETVRCSTCNECTDRNSKMFKYNENKQAYIADLEAGTFREMVEAAEACKLAIIHPGKPWNPDEANLEELMNRAAPFI